MFNEIEFYPTPKPIARQMLAKIQNKDAEYFLEPSAGKGDLVEAILEAGRYDRYGERSRHHVDVIEINPELLAAIRGKELSGVSIVGDDWLSYNGVAYHSAVLMNPPYSNGDAHLLKAWDFIHDGEIVCLLNEETIKNPCTKTRQRLVELIAKHGDVEYLGDVFKVKKGAQRPANVNVAMVYLKKQSEDDRIEVWATPTQEKQPGENIGDEHEQTMLAVIDELGNLEHYYNMSNEHMVKALLHLRKAALYMKAGKVSSRPHSRDRHERKIGEICEMAMGNLPSARAEFLRGHRRDAWYSVFDRMEFHKWLDNKQREQLLRDVETNGDIPFTADNIKATLDNVFSQRKRLFEQSVANVFDELCRYFKGNATGAGGGGEYSGWKSNDNYKVNQKLVFPYGLRYEAKYQAIGAWGMSYGRDTDIYTDLDRILCVLSGRQFEHCYTIGHAMDSAFRRLNLRPNHSTAEQHCESAFFEIRFFKKGTVHLKWKDLKLWESFNKTAAAGRKWLGANTSGKSEWPGRRPTYGNDEVQPEAQAEEFALVPQENA